MAAKQGDRHAFRCIYDAYVSQVYSLCLRLSADKSQAEDATQEVFIQLHKSIESYQGDSQFSTWLHRLATNVTISYLRKQKGWWQKMFSLDDSDIANQEADSATDLTDLEKHLMRLPERARWVFVLHALEGYRHEQIATMLNIAIGTSKAQFHRARGMLEEWLVDD